MSKVVLITGAGRKGSLGACIAAKFAEAGFKVALHYHTSKQDAETLAASLSDAVAFGGDLSVEKEAQKLVQSVEKQFGSLNVLVNNSGLYHMKDFQHLTETEWNEGIQSTASACFFTTRAALPLLRRSNQSRIINIGDSSCAKLGPRNLSISYHIGKTGVLLLTKSFAKSEAAHGITVNMVSPGILENSVDVDQVPPIPMKRLGSFDDIWNVVRFLTQAESQYVTGTNIIVSGGWNL